MVRNVPIHDDTCDLLDEARDRHKDRLIKDGSIAKDSIYSYDSFVRALLSRWKK